MTPAIDLLLDHIRTHYAHLEDTDAPLYVLATAAALERQKEQDAMTFVGKDGNGAA